MSILLIKADARHLPLADNSVHMVVTSPPYYGLRDYGIANQLGLEKSPEEYVANLVEVFREVRRVLRPDGTVWLVLGDSYCTRSVRRDDGMRTVIKAYANGDETAGLPKWSEYAKNGKAKYSSELKSSGLKDKDLIMIPARVALALQADGAASPETMRAVDRIRAALLADFDSWEQVPDKTRNLIEQLDREWEAAHRGGWYLRSDIIWCLSGGTWLYARTQKGDMPIMVRDIARLRPETVKLWNGTKWTRLLGMNRSHRRGDEIELVLRSGERISATPTHRFPTERGLLEAEAIVVGDKLQSCALPQPEHPLDCSLDEDAAWLAGLYLAEGSRCGEKIQLAGHAKEGERWCRCERIARKFGGSATLSVNGNSQNIRLYGKVLNAIIDELVSGRVAKDKCFAPVVWRYSNAFLSAMLDGYLSGDGHYDTNNDRWRLGFTRNYNLERDLRTACSRLGYRLTLNFSFVEYDGRLVPTYRGEIRKTRSGHHNEKCMTEVVEIRKARCREVYDLGVEDDPHVFALASGVLTHNSKPNPMPESVRDRPTASHEHVFLLTKSARYFYDAEGIKEAATQPAKKCGRNSRANVDRVPRPGLKQDAIELRRYVGFNARYDFENPNPTRNRRSVWTIATEPTPYAHFATYPRKLVEPCIKAGTSERGCCSSCGAPWKRLTKTQVLNMSNAAKAGTIIEGKGHPTDQVRDDHDIRNGPTTQTETIGWQSTCSCNREPKPCLVLDPFCGSGTTLEVAEKLGRNSVGIDLSYQDVVRLRLQKAKLEKVA